MSRPASNTPEHTQAARAVEKVKAALEQLERARSLQPHSGGGVASEPVLKARLELARAELRLAEGAEAFNRTAGDLEGLRSFLLSALEAARSALDVAPPTPPPPLSEVTPEALAAHVTASEEYFRVAAELAAARGPAMQRLASAWQAASAAAQLIVAARKARGEPAPSIVVPTPRSELVPRCPGNLAEIYEAIEAIEAQREPRIANGWTHHEQRVREIEGELAELKRIEREQAKTRFQSGVV